MTAIFVTATGTDIGKTYLAAGLIRHWRANGRAVDAIKPLMTGYDPAAAATSDAGVLLTALGRPATATEIEGVSPWRFAKPVAPDLAARLENRKIDFDALVAFSRRAVDARRDVLLIEGVGGIMVPLDERHTVLDWMIAVGIPLVLVTGTYLGAISHTLTALEVLAQRKLSVTALVINETPGSAVTMHSTSESIANLASWPRTIVGLGHPSSDQNFAQIAALL